MKLQVKSTRISCLALVLCLFVASTVHGCFTRQGLWTDMVFGCNGQFSLTCVRTYAYDANNNLTNLTQTINSQQSTLNFTYDAYNRVSSFTNADGYVIQYRYDANGNLTNLVYPGGRNVYYAYDSLNRLTNVTDWTNRQTTITYDLASRVTSISRPNNTVRLIAYDAAGQTTNITEKTKTGFPIAFFALGWTNSGRVAWEFAAPLPPTNPPPYRSMVYNDDNQIATLNSTNTLVYDNDGNMTTGPLTNSTLATYTYDARNRLLAIGNLQYGYDPAGNRTSITNGTNVVRFVVNPNAALPQTLIRIQPDRSQTFYVYGLGLLYEVNFDSGGTELNTRTYHYDYRSSTVALTDGNGMPTDQVSYSPSGMMTYRAGTTATPFLYNGRYGVMTDSNGLLYMRARYYNPYLCRFINADPAGFGGGLNWYAYANGNPVSRVDPFGLGAVGDSGGNSWIGDWARGFSSGLESFANGEDLSRYTPTGSDAYQSGVTSGYNAVPSAIELASMALAVYGAGAALEAGAAAEGTAAAEGGVWSMGPGPRGLAIESQLGGNLPPGFRVIDRFENGVATSIKSIDLNASTYQNAQALGSRLNGYIDRLAGWTGQTTPYAGVTIQPGQVTARTLQIAVPPGSMNAAQQAVFNAAAQRAQGLGLNFVITPVP